jgi:SAM-dependent methyltransferase
MKTVKDVARVYKKEYINMKKDIDTFLIPTLNNMGYTQSNPDIIQKEFIEFSSTVSSSVLDIGAAFGITTLLALKKGAKVIANDIDKRHLSVIMEKTPTLLKHNLRLLEGRLPYDIKINKQSLGAILIARVLHFLSPVEIVDSLEKTRSWLEPTGKIFIVVTTPFSKLFEKVIPIYEENKKNKAPWPALMQDVHMFLSDKVQIPPFLNLFDKELLESLLTQTGFHIEQLFYFPGECPKKWLYDGREFLGCIARLKT